MYHTSHFSSVKHGFFTREGGTSQPPFDTLNLCQRPGESPQHLEENRRIVLRSLGCADKSLVTLKQIHSANVVLVTQPWSYPGPDTPEADALITRNPDIVLGIYTADCLPILLHDPFTQTIAALHAGWRGLALGVVESTICQMVAMGCNPVHILAVIGPCISQNNYEVGEDVYQAFPELSASHQGCFQNVSEGKYLFNLPGAACHILKSLGLKTVDQVKRDTYAEPEVFFSCRRALHRGESHFGGQISVISLE